MELPSKPNLADASARSEAPSISLAASEQKERTGDCAIYPVHESRARGGGTNPVPAYRIHRGKQLGYVRLNKRMIYLGKASTPESFDRYRRLLGEWLASGRLRGRDNSDTDVAATVSVIVDAYLAWARRYYKEAHGRQSSSGLAPVEAASKSLTARYGPTAAGEFGPVALKAVRHAMIEAGLCRNVINQRIGCIKRIFRWAVGEELLRPAVLQALTAVDPLRVGRSAARETQPVRPVPDEHVGAVLPFLPPTLRAMVQLQRLTGMRSGELCSLRSRGVDVRTDVWIYRPENHKTAYRGHERAVHIGPKGQAVLSPFLRSDAPDAFVFSPVRSQQERRVSQRCRKAANIGQNALELQTPASQRVCGSRCYDSRSYHRALRYAMTRAIRERALPCEKRWHPHQLRHRHATEVRQARGLEAARVLLGHRTLSQTLEYAEADAALATSLALELG
jgi:integrase